MLTKEEIAEIVLYCQSENKPYSHRLRELGIAEWRFYTAKSHYAKKQKEDGSVGEFIQLPTSGAYAPTPDMERTRGANPSAFGNEGQDAVRLSIDNGTGASMQIELPQDIHLLSAVIKNFLGHV